MTPVAASIRPLLLGLLLLVLGPATGQERTEGPPAEVKPDDRVGELRAMEGHTDRVYCVAFSPAGGFLFSASADRTVRMWDVASGKEVRQFNGHTEGVASVALTRDGRRMLTGSWDKSVRLWDVETGKELRKFEGH